MAMAAIMADTSNKKSRNAIALRIVASPIPGAAAKRLLRFQ